jgi:sugar lactone lactonase YvrE
VDNAGNVYVANGEVIVYDPAGHQVQEVDVPERPIDLVFGGKDLKTLFILAHHALFAATAK